ncbi:MAG: periplasmic heavy metal sensor [Verrucomicrobiales bacterium]|nr:periplasmic heavy metal sensor [Verrucomicrobiales bacterium]
MNPPTRKTILLYLAATFVVGAVAGGALGYGAGRRPVFRPFDRDEMREKMCQRFTTELSLSPEQQKQLDPLMRQGMDEMDQAHREHRARLKELMKVGRDRMNAILTPEQRVKFDTMERERESRMQSKSKGPGAPPSSSPPH